VKEGLIEQVVQKVITEEAGGIEQREGSKSFRCRLTEGVVEVFCVGRWRPVATGRKTPLTQRALQQVRKTLELNHVLTPQEELILLYE